MTSRDPKDIMHVLDKRKEKRMATQPWNFASAGSIFRNPEQNQHGSILMNVNREVMKLEALRFHLNILILL